MEYLHKILDLHEGDVVEVTLDAPANVMLLTPENFAKYKELAFYRYHGGYVEKSPFRMPAPYSGEWHLVVNLGGYPGSVSAGFRVLPVGVVEQP